ncbi:CoA pyrophosphatase [Sphingomonas sp.]|jgi:8-oxo-dGTP pyrophosphatase MutT (NUDIX family)|uniref:CoA pyrophosphatase n=1 Tax=Sphingomonas sp. TaxID=28214 RepID=UPI002E34A6B4|nr:CoA pyrophosphatase [Sphingomonas sp.]HEX4694119.1 CoA pyrophosphatase [Sphingomonas sp.]
MTLAERLRAALTADDHTPILLAGDQRIPPFDAGDPAAAAVLVAITDRPEPGVILTQRTETLRRHAGQVAFPGGRIDPEDVDAAAAALREAEEEIALPRDAVEVIGPADLYLTVTGFSVTPVIGVIAPDLDYRPNEAEVADVFEVPLAFVFDPANQVETQAEWQGRTRTYYEINWRDRRIWGATAAMIVNLSRRLRWVA